MQKIMIAVILGLGLMGSNAQAKIKEGYSCAVWPNSAFPTQVCAKNDRTGQCTVSWYFENDDITKTKQRRAMDSCQRYLGYVVTSFDPSQYYCDVWPNKAFPDQVCAKSKRTGQCTQSWHFKKDDINRTKEREAYRRCEQFLGKAITSWNPANYYCDLFPNAAFPTEVCARNKRTNQCTHSWPFKNDNITKTKQKEAFRKCEAFLGR